MSDIKLNLRMSDGQFKDFVQTFVPVSKTLEYISKEADLYNEHGDNVPQNILDEFRIGFVAELFDSEEVTKSSILNGLDTKDHDVIMDIILGRVLGIEKEEVVKKSEKKKK